MKLLFFLLLFPCCIHAQQSHVKPQFELNRGGLAMVDKKGHTIDSEFNGNYYIWNYKKVPPIGLYADTFVYREKDGALYQVAVFNNRKRIVWVTLFEKKGEDANFHYLNEIKPQPRVYVRTTHRKKVHYGLNYIANPLYAPAIWFKDTLEDPPHDAPYFKIPYDHSLLTELDSLNVKNPHYHPEHGGWYDFLFILGYDGFDMYGHPYPKPQKDCDTCVPREYFNGSLAEVPGGGGMPVDFYHNFSEQFAKEKMQQEMVERLEQSIIEECKRLGVNIQFKKR